MTAAAKNTQEPIHSVRLGSSGPMVVMLHGWQRSSDTLRPLGELLANSCRVVLVDLPGFGMSPLPVGAANSGGGWSTLDYCERVRSFLEDEGIDRCTLVGHSFGGRVAVRMAARYPEQIEKLILTGTPGLRRTRPLREEVKVRAIRLAVSFAKWFDGTFGTRFFPHYLAERVGSRDYQAAGELRRTLVKTVNEDLSEDARSIAHRTLLLWGAEDSEAPVDIARSFHSLMRNSTLHVLPHKGHEPFADVGAHLVCGYIERFLQERDPR